MVATCLHFDPFSGISGDMTLGALLDLGMNLQFLNGELAKLGLSGYEISAEALQCRGIGATRCHVRMAETRAHRHLAQIEHIIQSSQLPEWVKSQSVAAFARLAQAEAKIHRQPVEEVHFHEVGALDAIIDVVGSMIGFHYFGVQEISSAPVNVGGGQVRCEHGVFPVPAPATAELLKGIPTYGESEAGELATPTGAAILTTLCQRFGGQPLMRVRAIGYGAGEKPSGTRANVLRMALGERGAADEDLCGSQEGESVVVIEATIDDMSPQVFGYFFHKAMGAGALDVFTAPIYMKKNRPGVLLNVVCNPDKLGGMLRLVFRETTTLGVRVHSEGRATLQRMEVAVKIPQGDIRMKVAILGQEVVNVMAEYEDCRRASESSGVPLKIIQARAMHEFMKTARQPYGGPPEVNATKETEE